MNRKLIYLLLLVLPVTGCKKSKVELSGKLDNPVAGSYLYLDELTSNELVTVDSVIISDDGNFYFQRGVKHPSFYLLKINQNNFLTMLFEPGDKIKINARFDSLNYPSLVSGSRGTQLMTEYNKKLQETIDNIRELGDIYRENIDSPELAGIMEKLDSLAQDYLNELNLYTRNYIDDNITSLVSLVALYQQVAPGVYVLNPEDDLEYFMKVDSSMYRRYPDYEPVQALRQQVIELAERYGFGESVTAESANGLAAPEISLPNPDGDTIKLSSTRGSVVLLDFWASWCSPCRNENPNLVEAYNRYSNKGFQIYQVSLDKSKDAWVKGIKEDNLGRWIHVSDIKYWNSVVVPLYNISSIPYNLLLDRDGNVLASNLRGNALHVKLAEVFGQQ